MDPSILINWTIHFQFQGCLVYFFFMFILFRIEIPFSKQWRPDQTSRSAASDLGLQWLPMSQKWDARLIWLNEASIRIFSESNSGNEHHQSHITLYLVYKTSIQCTMLHFAFIIRIKNDFVCINICWAPKKMLHTRAWKARNFKTSWGAQQM